MQQEIKGFHDHPNSDKLLEYDMEPPAGVWTGRLDDRAWGTSANLFCFFTNTSTEKKYRLSVYSQKGYRPSNKGPAFDEEPIGGIFEITTKKSPSGLPTFLNAKKIS